MKVLLGIVGYLIVASILGPIFLFDVPGIGPYLFAGLILGVPFIAFIWFIIDSVENKGFDPRSHGYSRTDLDRARDEGFEEGRRGARW